jgi:hypothetical protein
MQLHCISYADTGKNKANAFAIISIQQELETVKPTTLGSHQKDGQT